jgi:hypothetical protein
MMDAMAHLKACAFRGIAAHGKISFWVAQRFQRCDKCSRIGEALAAGVIESIFQQSGLAVRASCAAAGLCLTPAESRSCRILANLEVAQDIG